MAARESSSTAAHPDAVAVGVTTAAAVVLILPGVLKAMQGVVALATNEFYVVTQRWLFQFDVSAWGWVHVLVGGDRHCVRRVRHLGIDRQRAGDQECVTHAESATLNSVFRADHLCGSKDAVDALQGLSFIGADDRSPVQRSD